MTRILLKDAQTCEPGRISRQCILIEDGRIAKIAPQISAPGAEEVDCSELLALPGMIDAHAHFRQPGMEQKADIASESRAAVLGGVTSYMEMPNTLPPATSMERVQEKQAIAARDSAANYAFYLGAGADNLEDIKKVDVRAVPAVKVYMGSTTGNLLLDDTDTLYKVFQASPLMICTHCEDNALINEALKTARASYGDDIPFSMHPVIRGRDCCLKSAKTAINTALETNARLHIMHLSTREEVTIMQYFSRQPLKERQITAEACIPHLFFSEADYQLKKGFLKCNPAVKTEADRRALVEGIKKGFITTVGTDHAPHELQVKTGSYLGTASGLPSVQFALQALLELWQRRELTLEEVITVTSKNPAALYQIKDRGALVEGYFADIALVNPVQGFTVSATNIASKCGWSPFTGHHFTTAVVHTLVNGEFAVRDGRLTGQICSRPLEFDRDN